MTYRHGITVIQMQYLEGTLLCRFSVYVFIGVLEVPVVFRCKGCGNVIFVFERVGQDCFGVPSPSELSLRLGGKCPRCGRVLQSPTLDDVKVVGRLRGSLRLYISELETPSIPSHDGFLSTASVSQ